MAIISALSFYRLLQIRARPPISSLQSNLFLMKMDHYHQAHHLLMQPRGKKDYRCTSMALYQLYNKQLYRAFQVYYCLMHVNNLSLQILQSL